MSESPKSRVVPFEFWTFAGIGGFFVLLGTIYWFTSYEPAGTTTAGRVRRRRAAARSAAGDDHVVDEDDTAHNGERAVGEGVLKARRATVEDMTMTVSADLRALRQSVTGEWPWGNAEKSVTTCSTVPRRCM